MADTEGSRAEDRPEVEVIPGRPLEVRSLVLTGLFLIAGIHLLHFAQVFLVPIFLASLLHYLLAPLVRLLGRLRIGPKAGAALVLAVALGALGFGAQSLAVPAKRWFEELPRVLRDRASRIESITGPVEQVQETAEQVEELATIDDPPPYQRAMVIETRPSVTEVVLGGAWRFLAGAVVTTALLFFLLATPDSFLLKTVKLLPRMRDKKLAVEIGRRVESQLSRYVVTISAINAGLGVLVGLVTWAFGLPNPALWGAMAGLFNFVPYLGSFVGCTVVGLVAFISLDALAPVAGVVAAYATATAFEGMVFTPWVLGERFAMSPVAVLVWFLFWAWLWGIAGALLAMPMLVALGIVCGNVPPLRPVATLLERGRRQGRGFS